MTKAEETSGTCILHSMATLDDPILSFDHPAFSFENLLFSCVEKQIQGKDKPIKESLARV